MARSDMVEGPTTVCDLAPPPLSFAERSPSPPLRGREEQKLTIRDQPSAVGQQVERVVGDYRLEADPAVQLDLALERAAERIDIDQGAVRSGKDQPLAGQHRADIADRPLAVLLVAVAGQLVDPADLAGAAGDRHQLRLVVDRENPVPGDPRRRDSAEVQFPDVLARVEVERDHSAALADG